MTQEDTIRDIRKRCRLAMNGVASASMRDKGASYKLNFGLVIQQIKTIADKYEQNAELAEMLWNEDVRELKILATLLYPATDFARATADRWIQEIPNQEIREQLCLNLLQNLPYANEAAPAWANSTDEAIRATGYWLIARLFLAKKINSLHPDVCSFIWQDAVTEDTFLRNATLLALKHIGRQSKNMGDNILNKLSVYKEDADLIKQEAYNSLAFEFEYYFES